MIAFSELVLVVKFGLDLFSHTQISKICIWLTLNVVVSCFGVFGSVKLYRWKHKREDVDSSEKDDFGPPTDDEPFTSEELVKNFIEKNNETVSGSEAQVRKRNVKLPA